VRRRKLGRHWTLKPSARTCVDVCSANPGARPLNDIVKLTEAYRFAADRHVGQRRKGEAAEPYVNHLTEVADLVARGTGGADVELVMAAVLHDTVEDTDTTFEEIAARFGPRVAGLVAEVTDDKTLPKEVRKRLQVEHAAHASQGAKVIKLADKTSNLRAMADSPPRNWSEARRAEYLEWGRQVVANCRGANPWLEAKFDAAAAVLETRVGVPA
jgi:(p)ppGpp synthase/HD superfamily hydrolase